jgi:hypothetical protein
VVEPVTGLLIFAGSWLAKKLAKDWAEERKDAHFSGFQAASVENTAARETCTELQEQARGSMGRIGIQRIESMRRVLPHAANAARLAEAKGHASAVFNKEKGWFGGYSQRSLLGLSSSLIALDLVLPDDAPVTAAETLLSTLAAQGAYKAFETLPHHEGLDGLALNPAELNDSLMAGVGMVEDNVGKVDDFFSSGDVAHDAAAVADSLDVDAINQLSDGASQMVASAAGAVGDGVTGAMAEVGGAMDVLGDFIGDFVGPAGWALAGWTLGGTLMKGKKLKGMREEVRVNTEQLKERTERAKRIVARGEQIEKLNAEASYKAFKHAWIMKQVGKKRFRSKGWRERDAKRAALLESSARNFWQVMHAPLLGEGGDAAGTPLPAVRLSNAA